MITVFWHKEIIETDLPTVSNDLEHFEEFYSSFTNVLNGVKKKPIRSGWELRYDLEGWTEYKFFSRLEPPLKMTPDMRLVYHYRNNYLYILVVGLRNSKETRESDDRHSIYHIAVNRLKLTTMSDWVKIEM